MHEYDLNRVEFYSKDDLASGYNLSKGEHILRSESVSSYTDINDILELYHLKKYIDNDVYLNTWTQEDTADFKRKAAEYTKLIGRFIANINDSNIVDLYKKILRGYVDSFWELVNNQGAFKRISKESLQAILSDEPHVIHTILSYKSLIDYFDTEIKSFLLTYPKSAEILLSTYEVETDFRKNKLFIPKSLAIDDKESIISSYLDSNDVNLNYVGLILNSNKGVDFRISDKTKLKAKRLHKIETEKIFEENSGMRFGVAISFRENMSKIKDGYVDENQTANYSYSLDFIKQNSHPYLLFQNFKVLFEYLDNQNRIALLSRKNDLGVLERVIGFNSQTIYRTGVAFNIAEMTSYAQISGYDKIINQEKTSLEDILHFTFTTAFQKKYGFADSSRFLIPSSTISYFERVRILAPEFESVLKQFKLFVEDGNIDFELLQISSSPTSIRDIPSLNPNKYIYFNENNNEMVGCSNLFFSDQTLLAYVEPYKEKHYRTFFEILVNEQVNFDNYEDYDKPKINYLKSKGFITIDDNGLIQIANFERVRILKDLYDNEFASYYHYPLKYQKEAQQMMSEDIIRFESSLFSKPEQAYYNYYLNKREFTNGLDLRNSYLHGTQAGPDEVQKHENAYYTYLKLLVLAMLKIEDDLFISNSIKK